MQKTDLEKYQELQSAFSELAWHTQHLLDQQCKIEAELSMASEGHMFLASLFDDVSSLLKDTSLSHKQAHAGIRKIYAVAIMH
jgi:hypothetical protein